MASALPQPRLSIQAFLDAEQLSQVRHEYASGFVFAMAGGSKRHNRIVVNVSSRLNLVTRDGTCQTYASNFFAKIGDVLYYPDVMAACEETSHDLYHESPCLIAEVLSPSTERIDRGEKLYNYRQIGTLLNYLLIAQDRVHVDLYRRKGSAWLLETYVNLDDEIALVCPSCSLPLKHIYQQVEFAQP